jgi:hypothetical protein
MNRDEAIAPQQEQERAMEAAQAQVTYLDARLAKVERRLEKLKQARRWEAACAAMASIIQCQANAHYAQSLQKGASAQGDCSVQQYVSWLAFSYADAMLAEFTKEGEE